MQETLQNHNALLNELPETLGAVLTRARLAKKLDIREASRRIGLDASVIQALEEDDYEHLGAPVFARNFLLRYSRLLELSEADVLERWRQMGLDEPPPLKVERPIQRQARMTDMRWLAYPVVVVGVLWLSYVGFERLNVHYSPGAAQTSAATPPAEERATTVSPEVSSPVVPTVTEGAPSPASPMAPALAAINDPTGLTDFTDLNSAEAEETALLLSPSPETVTEADQQPLPDIAVATEVSAEDAATEPESTASAGVETTGSTATETVTTVTGAGSELLTTDTLDDAADDTLDDTTPMVAVASVLPEGQYQLELTFSDDCWVEVRDANGERLVRAILNANTVNRYVGQAPFSLTLGNTAAVTSITLNGEPVDASVYTPSQGNVSRFTLEAPQG